MNQILAQRKISTVFALILLVIVPFALPAASETCAVIDIDQIGFENTESLKNVAGAQWWIEMGRELLLCGTADLTGGVIEAERRINRIYSDIDPSRIRLVRGEHQQEAWGHQTLSLLRQSRFEVIHISKKTNFEPTSTSWRTVIEPLQLPAIIIRQIENSPRVRTKKFAQTTQGLVDQVDESLWFADLETLASFNRYSLGDGIFDAENWIVQQLQALPNMVVTTPGFTMGGRTVHNVVGSLTGLSRPDEWYIVGGHYDSTSQNTTSSAPGAEDNASGCAGVLEMARIFSANPPSASVFFICFVGEEQGLLGAIEHASNLVTTGDDSKVSAMLNMDMIGYTADTDLDCLLESEAIGQSLIDGFSAAAATFTSLRIETTLFAWGSDHVPYLDRGIPAVLTIENDWDQYSDYHSTTDLPQNISLDMGRETLKMNVAALAEMVDPQEAPIFTDGFESGDINLWSSSTP